LAGKVRKGQTVQLIRTETDERRKKFFMNLTTGKDHHNVFIGKKFGEKFGENFSTKEA
jgi:hypothetical protein